MGCFQDNLLYTPSNVPVCLIDHLHAGSFMLMKKEVKLLKKIIQMHSSWKSEDIIDLIDGVLKVDKRGQPKKENTVIKHPPHQREDEEDDGDEEEDPNLQLEDMQLQEVTQETVRGAGPYRGFILQARQDWLKRQREQDKKEVKREYDKKQRMLCKHYGICITCQKRTVEKGKSHCKLCIKVREEYEIRNARKKRKKAFADCIAHGHKKA